MRFIESYGFVEDPQEFEIEGRVVSIPCLVEDEDGIRIMAVHTGEDGSVRIPVRAWSAAHAAGASALYDTRMHSWMKTETFIEGRSEDHARSQYVAPSEWNRVVGSEVAYRDMIIGQREIEASAPTTRLVHVHAHSEYSPLDGMASIKDMVKMASSQGASHIAVTDHGVNAGHPELQKTADAAGIKPVFGIEANFVHDRILRGNPEIKEGPGSSRYVLGDYYHLLLWAMTNEGLENMWAMSTEANATGYYGRPRMDWEIVERYSEGVMAGTGCLRGPLARDLLDGNHEAARANLARLMSIFPGRLYVEIHTNHIPDVMRLNVMLVELAREFNLPIVASIDSHYVTKSEAPTHEVWIASQTNKELTDDTGLFEDDQPYHMMDEAEVREALSYLAEHFGPDVVDDAIENTSLLAERCEARVEGTTHAPIYSKVGADGDTSVEARIQQDVKRLTEMCLSRWDKVLGKRFGQDVYMARFEREMKLLISKSFCGYFLMVADYCAAAKDGRVGSFDPVEIEAAARENRPVKGRPIIVGPGRGSGGGTLVGYLSSITEIDPVDGDLIFERFMTDGREGLPDFDVDFPESKRPALNAYLADKYGDEYILRVGTHMRVRNKAVVNDMARVLKNTIDINFEDIRNFSKIVDEAEADKAGLGMSWEDLWNERPEDLGPLRERYPLLFQHADLLVDRLKGYGKHPAGVIISTDIVLTDKLPMRRAGDEKNGYEMVAEFDLDSLEDLGYVKFDLLTLRTLDSIQGAIDLVYEEYGVEIDLYSWRDEYEDPQVWEELSEGHTLGVFQVETRAGTRTVKRFQPKSLSEFADVITVVRPGPTNSGLTDAYYRRRNGLEEITYPDPRLEQVLEKTHGTMLYQEDIMAATMILAGYDSNEADAVRKILGKKQIEKVAEAGVKFIDASVERGMAREDAEHLWEQMAEFSKYSFNRAHAYGYAILGHWTAWLKFHYPRQYLTSLMTTVDKTRIPEFVNEARRMGYKVLPPDINISGVGFTSRGDEIRYGLDSMKGVGDAAVRAIMYGQPYTSFDDYMDRKGSKANIGVTKILASVGVFDSVWDNRKTLEAKINFDDKESGVCTFKDPNALGPGGLPCTFDWDNEENPPMVSKGKGKDRVSTPKPPPKRCTKACRNFAEPVFSVEEMLPYTKAEIREKEMALLGIHLSSTPFDEIPKEILENECYTAEQVEAGPSGEYAVAATVSAVKRHVTRTGSEMAFMSAFAQTANVDVTVFSRAWEKYESILTPGALLLLYMQKNDRGISLVDAMPLKF